MGISLSNKDYIAFTIKKKKKGKERHDYDAIADYNKTIIKKRIEEGGGKGIITKKRERKGKKKTKLALL